VGGWGVALLTGIGTPIYLSSVRRFLDVSDLAGGLIKSALFGIIIALIGSHRGMTADGGAAGVGRAATTAVVAAIVLILVGNLFLDVLLF
ncbi:MAG: ABC transporter permease, partial [bacterium]